MSGGERKSLSSPSKLKNEVENLMPPRVQDQLLTDNADKGQRRSLLEVSSIMREHESKEKK